MKSLSDVTKNINYSQTIVARLNFVKYQVKHKFDITSLDRKEKERTRRRKLLTSVKSYKFVVTRIRRWNSETIFKRKQGLNSNRVHSLSFFYESPLNKIVHHLVPRKICWTLCMRKNERMNESHVELSDLSSTLKMHYLLSRKAFYWNQSEYCHPWM